MLIYIFNNFIYFKFYKFILYVTSYKIMLYAYFKMYKNMFTQYSIYRKLPLKKTQKFIHKKRFIKNKMWNYYFSISSIKAEMSTCNQFLPLKFYSNRYPYLIQSTNLETPALKNYKKVIKLSEVHNNQSKKYIAKKSTLVYSILSKLYKYPL